MRYLVVGGLAYVVEISALYLLNHIAGLSPLSSVAISFWIGFFVAFVLQKFITFGNHDKRAHILARQLGLYSLLVGWNYLFTLLLVKLLVGTISVFIVRTIAILIITSWNYGVYKFLFKMPGGVDNSGKKAGQNNQQG
jgi:putative flippase GtrA